MRSEWSMTIVGLWSFSGATQWVRFDPTQCACLHNMSNRLIRRAPRTEPWGTNSL